RKRQWTIYNKWLCKKRKRYKTIHQSATPLHKGLLIMTLKTNYALVAAAIAAFIGALWATSYLTGTVYIGSRLSDYVMGTAHGLENNGGEALFIIGARFILAFGFSWAPLTLLLGLLANSTAGESNKEALSAAQREPSSKDVQTE